MQYSLRKLVYFRKYIVRHFCFSSILLPLNFVDQLIVFPFLKVLSCIIILISDSSSNVMDVSCAMIGRYLALVLLPLLNKWMRRFHKTYCVIGSNDSLFVRAHRMQKHQKFCHPCIMINVIFNSFIHFLYHLIIEHWWSRSSFPSNMNCI